MMNELSVRAVNQVLERNNNSRMNQVTQKKFNQARRKLRIRKKIFGTGDRPRLTVSISNKHVSAQIIDDTSHHTIASVSTIGASSKYKGTMTQKAALIGTSIAQKAKKSKVQHVVLDRNGRMYHGRIKALADAARKEGLEF